MNPPLSLALRRVQRITGSLAPRGVLSMAAYLGGGVALGLAFVVVLLVTRETTAAAATTALPAAVTDDLVHLRTTDLPDGCEDVGGGRLDLALDVGIDGRVRLARAASVTSGSAALARCVERHVASWEFLPQATATTMPLAIDVRAAR